MHAGLELDHWCGDAGALLRADHLPGPELDREAWARWLGALAVDGLAPMGVTVGEALHPLLAPLLELAGWRLARVNVSHAVFAHLPSFGSRSLVALRGDHHMPRGHAVPWLRTSRENGQQPTEEGEESCLADSGPSTTVFAGSRLGASAPFLLFALGRSEPPLVALELRAKILRMGAPFPLHSARGERVRASVWLRLAALYCDVARLLEAPARDASPEQSAYADGLRVLGPLAASWCAANGTFRRVMTTRSLS